MVCNYCGNSRNTQVDRAWYKKGFCKKRCLVNFHKNNLDILTVCSTCSKEFQKSKYLAWCSDECKNKYDIELKIIKSYKKKKKKKDFYETDKWLSLRYKVLKSMGRVCSLCRATDGQMHVDHIKPRSKYPHLSLVEDNLQVLCRACNLGKSNTDETDWRKK